MYRIGIDVGGTFTDLAAVDDFGVTTLTKVASTPGDPADGVFDGLKLLAEMLSLEPRALLAQTERIVHGTTVATNALIEHRGARVGLLTTEGHRDVIEMREGFKDDRYNLRLPPPEQLVPRKLRLGVRERLRADGRVDTPLDPASLDRAIAVLERRKPRRSRFAICIPGATRGTSGSPVMLCCEICLGLTSRYPRRCCRRSRSSKGYRPPSSTPISDRLWRAI